MNEFCFLSLECGGIADFKFAYPHISVFLGVVQLLYLDAAFVKKR